MSATPINEKPYMLPLCIAFIGLLIGAGIGWAAGAHTLQATVGELARQSDFVCGTGLVFLPVGYALFGMFAGAMPGVVIAMIIYRRKRPRGKSDWAAYYGR